MATIKPVLSTADIRLLKTVFATKKDLDRFATKTDLANFATKKDLDGFATKTDLAKFATKKDLENFATKNDVVDIVLASERRLKRRMGKQKQEITDLMVKLAETTPTRKEFNVLKEQVEFLTPY